MTAMQTPNSRILKDEREKSGSSLSRILRSVRRLLLSMEEIILEKRMSFVCAKLANRWVAADIHRIALCERIRESTDYYSETKRSS